VIPAVIALWFRLTIIGSPRYTADVSGDTAKAASELKRYLLKSHEIGLVSATAVTVDNVAYSHPPVRRSTSSGARSGPLSTAIDTTHAETQPLSRRSVGAVSVGPAEGEHEAHPLTHTSSGAISVESGARSDDGSAHYDTSREEHGLPRSRPAALEGPSAPFPTDPRPMSQQVSPGYMPGELDHTQFGTAPYRDDPEADIEYATNRLSGHPSMQLFMTSNVQALPQEIPINGSTMVYTDDNKQPPPPSWKDFKDYFWHKGNLRTLMATSICWFCVDLPCKYALFEFVVYV
jgi:hypothetical protein